MIDQANKPSIREMLVQHAQTLLDRTVDRDSSPGYPYMRAYKTNGEFIDAAGTRAIAEKAVSRLLALAGEDLTQMQASRIVAGDFADPVRLFVKNELHSKQKIEQGRMRLISSVSLVDQLVERLLCGGQNSAEIANWTDIPSKPGLGLDDRGLEALRSSATAMQEPLATDMSGFDWSVPQWLLDMDVEARVRLSGATRGGLFERALRSRVAALGCSLFVLSDGSLFAQTRRGVQKSGSYNTSATNSRMRVMLAYMAAAVATGGVTQGAVMAAGDDCIEDIAGVDSAALLSVYARWGFRVETSAVLDFCSFVFGPLGFSRPRRAKIAASLFAKKPADAMAREGLLCALRYDLRHETAFMERVEQVVRQVGWGLAKLCKNA